MSEVHYGDISRFLEGKDPVIIERWQEFYHHSRLLTDQSERARRIYRESNFDGFTVLRECLKQWVSERQTGATINVLAEILREGRFNYLRDELLEKYPNLNSKVVLGHSETELNNLHAKPAVPNDKPLQPATSSPTLRNESARLIKYEKNDKIGEGSRETIVYKGTFNEDLIVAVKVMNKRYYVLEEAKKEIENLRTFENGNNIIRYFGCEEDEEYLCIALELCKASIDKWVQTKGKCIEPAKISQREILSQTCEGLYYMHLGDVIHRDIKPENLLLSVDNITNKVIVKLADFDLCKRLEGKPSKTQKTGTGTEGWMAYEMVRHVVKREKGDISVEFKITKAADIFSLGCVFYYVLTFGEHPFGKASSRRNFKIYNYAKEIKEDLLSDYGGSVNLIAAMIAQNAEGRPSIADVREHHLFWSDQKTLNFLEKIKCVKSTNAKAKSCIDSLQTMTEASVGIVAGNLDGWKSRVCDVLKPFLNENYHAKMKKGNLVMDLIGQIRNMHQHYEDDEYITIRGALGENTVGTDGNIPFLRYWTIRFPTLVPNTWLAFQDLRNEYGLEKYYPETYKF